tara:strand:+ start:79304 stop:79561 length:258 start_codon:yes stop_codon:yes gene_type:complete
MNEDELRKEFEKWAKTQHHDVSKPFSRSKNYASGYTEFCWRAWKASREALCVSLPKPFGSSLMCNDFLTYEEVIEALDKAGVKYK